MEEGGGVDDSAPGDGTRTSPSGDRTRDTPVGLHVDTPFFRVETVGLQGSLLAETLDLVHDLVAPVVTSPGKTLGILRPIMFSFEI